VTPGLQDLLVRRGLLDFRDHLELAVLQALRDLTELVERPDSPVHLDPAEVPVRPDLSATSALQELRDSREHLEHPVSQEVVETPDTPDLPDLTAIRDLRDHQDLRVP